MPYLCCAHRDDSESTSIHLWTEWKIAGLSHGKFVPAWKSTPTANKVPLIGISVSLWSLGSRAIPRIPSWKEYIRKELRPVIDNSKREMLDGGQTNIIQFSLGTFHITKQAANPKTTRIPDRSEEKKNVTSPQNIRTGAKIAAYLHRRAGHCAGCSQ